MTCSLPAKTETLIGSRSLSSALGLAGALVSPDSQQRDAHLLRAPASSLIDVVIAFRARLISLLRLGENKPLGQAFRRYPVNYVCVFLLFELDRREGIFLGLGLYLGNGLGNECYAFVNLDFR